MTEAELVVIVGAGVSGLTTGVVLREAGLPVRIVAEEIPGRTSLAAGAMWGPYLAEPRVKVREWSLVSLKAFRELAQQQSKAADEGSGGMNGPDVPQSTGVRLVTGVEAARHPLEAPPWSKLLPGFRTCEPAELPPEFVSGHRFTVPLIDMPVYLDYLRTRFLALGGEIEAGAVRSLDDIAHATTIVNCAGLTAGDLARDPDVRPIGGQHVIVENPGITEFFSEDTGLSPDLVCIYPHGDTVTLGGTAIGGNGDLPVDEAAAQAIIDRCTAIEPRLADAKVIEHRVGARPTRHEVRVEAARKADGTTVIHNYGHGGAGVTLSWGCAQEVMELLEQSTPWPGRGNADIDLLPPFSL
ncbi:FAD-dependent oxidoreductase [Streptomyces sp. NPDC002851]